MEEQQPVANGDSPEGVFSRLLRRLRSANGVSQEALAVAADTTPRYISFLENDRARPSRDMVARLAIALELEDIDRCRLWEAGGYLPRSPEIGADPTEYAPVRAAVNHMLQANSPNPAMLMDRDWNIMQLNPEAERLMRLTGYTAQAESIAGYNLIEVTLDPAALRPVIANWHEYAWRALYYLEQQSMRRHEPLEILERVRALPDIPAIEAETKPPQTKGPVAHLLIKEDGAIRPYFAMRCMLGDPVNTITRNLRIEILFPGDPDLLQTHAGDAESLAEQA
jgi:transcriptional regulator with XRE-family HTH domain